MAAATVTAAAEARHRELLYHLRRCPGLTSSQLQQATGRTHSAVGGDLAALAASSKVTSRLQRLPQLGRMVTVWFTPGEACYLSPARLKQNQDYAAKSGHRARPGSRKPLPGGGACSGTDTELFFPKTKEDEAAAVAICGRCPIRAACLDYATARGERFGIWGGKNFDPGHDKLPSRTDLARLESPLRTLPPLDKAAKFADLRARHGSVRAAARAAKVNPSTVRFYLDLHGLDTSTQAHVRAGRLTASDAVQAVRRARRDRAS